jgi:hypothetical protein
MCYYKIRYANGIFDMQEFQKERTGFHMRKSKAAKIIERIAAENGVSVAEVRRDMQEAINLAFESGDSFWNRWRGQVPTPEEFLSQASKEILNRLNFGSVPKQ